MSKEGGEIKEGEKILDGSWGTCSAHLAVIEGVDDAVLAIEDLLAVVVEHIHYLHGGKTG